MKSDRGISSIIVVVVVLLGVLGLAFLSNSLKKDDPVKVLDQNDKLKSLDSQFYTLSLPQDFEEISRKTNNGATIIHYGDPDDSYKGDAGLSLIIAPIASLKDSCQEEFDAIKENIQTVPGGKVNKTEEIKLSNALVCDSSWTTPVDGQNVQDAVITHQKRFSPKGDKGYIVIGTYFDSHPESYKNSVEKALSQFAVK